MGWLPGSVCALDGLAKGPMSRGGLPVADAETSDAVRHLDNDELATALHLARLALPDLG